MCVCFARIFFRIAFLCRKLKIFKIELVTKLILQFSLTHFNFIMSLNLNLFFVFFYFSFLDTQNHQFAWRKWSNKFKTVKDLDAHAVCTHLLLTLSPNLVFFFAQLFALMSKSYLELNFFTLLFHAASTQFYSDREKS